MAGRRCAGRPGRLLGDGGRGHDAESPAPFVMNDGGMRRARPAGPPDLAPPGLGKLFLAAGALI